MKGIQIMLSCFVLVASFSLVLAHDEDGHFTNDWVVRLIGGRDVVDQLARELDYQNLGEVVKWLKCYSSESPWDT
ncbi:hypothetical protein CEXT_526161 [Caerostris extrusa]|uniref:Uncharacterized protein n=1 Tax=Caerostris extrusa TaxID=172846 RepID=A0AAV4PX85_CAEEX|nr:hypothetical protein CEXT_526161 [Caerostris extrusa]